MTKRVDGVPVAFWMITQSPCIPCGMLVPYQHLRTDDGMDILKWIIVSGIDVRHVSTRIKQLLDTGLYDVSFRKAMTKHVHRGVPVAFWALLQDCSYIPREELISYRRLRTVDGTDFLTWILTCRNTDIETKGYQYIPELLAEGLSSMDHTDAHGTSLFMRFLQVSHEIDVGRRVRHIEAAVYNNVRSCCTDVVNRADFEGTTPLMLACRAGIGRQVHDILKLGGDAHYTCPLTGRSPMTESLKCFETKTGSSTTKKKLGIVIMLTHPHLPVGFQQQFWEVFSLQSALM
jgi:hypothetical protein